MKKYLKRKQCTTQEEYKNFFTPEKCYNYIITANNYISRIEKVMDIVIERQGDWSDC